MKFTKNFIVTSGWTSWSEYSPCIQQTWGEYLCTRARVKICMGTSNCDGADDYGTMSEVQNCKKNPQLSATCSSEKYFLMTLLFIYLLNIFFTKNCYQ